MLTLIILTFAIIALGVAVMAAFGVCSLFVRFGQWYKSYEKLAARYNGSFKAGSLFSRPSLTFRHADSNCLLKNRNQTIGHGSSSTQLIVDGHDPKIKLLVTTAASEVRYWNQRGLIPVSLPPEFAEHNFEAQCNFPEQAAAMFKASALWKLRQLAHHVGQDGIEIRLEQGKLTISQSGFIKEFQPLDDFVRFGLELHHQFAFKTTPEIEFVEQGLATIIETVQCPICSELIHQSMVICVRCKTPHCVDCWEYNGQCATFACGETRFLRSDQTEFSTTG